MNGHDEDLVGKWVIVKNDEIIEQDESLEKIYSLAKKYDPNDIIVSKYQKVGCYFY